MLYHITLLSYGRARFNLIINAVIVGFFKKVLLFRLITCYES